MESAFGMMGLPWMVMGFALLVVLALIVLFAAGAGRGKRKRDEDGAHKPKREPRYIVADDGELLEVTDDETPPQEKDKRRAAQ